jgi:hypothetical protein
MQAIDVDLQHMESALVTRLEVPMELLTKKLQRQIFWAGAEITNQN